MSDAVPGADPFRADAAAEPSRRLEVDGELFDVRPDGRGGTAYDWVSGPHAGYGFAVSPSPASPEQDREHIRGFLAMIDPATGYIGDD